jgi:type III secretion system FlhB-like substrate exporter
MNANAKYTTFDTRIQISLKYVFNQNKLPLIHSGERNIVAKNVTNANNTLIHLSKNSAIIAVLSINSFVASFVVSVVSANVTSDNNAKITIKNQI